MKITELPTHLLRDLAARCTGLNAVLGDGRVALKAVAEACATEIDARLEGKDFPVLSDEVGATLAARIKSSPPKDFVQLLYEVEE